MRKYLAMCNLKPMHSIKCFVEVGDWTKAFGLLSNCAVPNQSWPNSLYLPTSRNKHLSIL